MSATTRKLGPIAVGDLVVLKSGGPTMTVVFIETAIGDEAEVHWFAGKQLQTGRIPITCLRHADTPVDVPEPPR